MKHILALFALLLALSLPVRAQTLKWGYSFLNLPPAPFSYESIGGDDFYARGDAAGNIALTFTYREASSNGVLGYGILWLNRLGKVVHFKILPVSAGYDILPDVNPIVRVSAKYVLVRLHDINTGNTILRRYSMKGKIAVESDTVLHINALGGGSFLPENDGRMAIIDNPNGFFVFSNTSDPASSTQPGGIMYYTLK